MSVIVTMCDCPFMVIYCEPIMKYPSAPIVAMAKSIIKSSPKVTVIGLLIPPRIVTGNL